MLDIYEWVLGRQPSRPDFPMPIPDDLAGDFARAGTLPQSTEQGA